MSPKGFAALAVATALSLGLAGWALAGRDVPVTATAQSEPMFPGLLDHLNDVAMVKVSGGGKESLTLQKGDQGRWLIQERGGYPADGKRVREVALGLANLRLVEAKTAKPDLLPRLDLGDPAKPDAKAHAVQLLDKDGKPLAAAIVGKTKFGLYGGARSGVYVRRDGEDQAWLAAGQLDVPNGPTDVMVKEILDISSGEVGRITLAAGTPSPLVITKAEPKAEKYTLQATVPEGKKVDDEKLERVAGTLSSLTLQDVKPVAEVTFPPDAPKAQFQTWDGLDLEARVATSGEGDKAEHWIAFTVAQGQPLAPAAAPPAAVPPAPPAGDNAAAAPPPAPATADAADQPPVPPATKKKPLADQVADLKARLDGWAFKLPDYSASRMTWKIDDLLAAPEGQS